MHCATPSIHESIDVSTLSEFACIYTLENVYIHAKLDKVETSFYKRSEYTSRKKGFEPAPLESDLLQTGPKGSDRWPHPPAANGSSIFPARAQLHFCSLLPLGSSSSSPFFSTICQDCWHPSVLRLATSSPLPALQVLLIFLLISFFLC